MNGGNRSYTLLLCCAAPVFLVLTRTIAADTVVLKDGTQYRNVKASFVGGVVRVAFEDGNTMRIGQDRVSRLKFEPANWQLLVPVDRAAKEPASQVTAADALFAEAERISEASNRGSEWQPRPESDKKSEWGSFALGFVPPYSALFRTRNYGGGTSMTFFKMVAFINALDYATAKKDRSGETAEAAFILLFFGGSGNASLQPLLLLTVALNHNNTFVYKGGLTGRNLSNQDDSRDSRNSKYNQGKAVSAGLLLGIMLTDGMLGYMNTTEWNEGEWTGPSYARPTRPGSRIVRSLLFPGLGQFYAGSNVKGSLFAAGGLLALLASASADSKARAAREQVAFQRSNVIYTATKPGATYASTSAAMGSYDAAVSKYNALEAQRKSALSTFAVVYVLSLFDAALFNNPRLGPVPNVSVAPDIREGRPIGWGLQAGVTTAF